MIVQMKQEPPYRIRKHAEGWCLSKWVDFEGIVVEAFLGSWATHAIALAVLDAHVRGYSVFPYERY